VVLLEELSRSVDLLSSSKSTTSPMNQKLSEFYARNIILKCINIMA